MRNLVLFWGAPLATGLAVWRSSVAQKQVEVAQAGLLSSRYQRAVELLGNTRISVRLGGIQALRNIALEHYSEYQQEVRDLLDAYDSGPGRADMMTRLADGMPITDEKIKREIEEWEKQVEEQVRKDAIRAIEDYGERLSQRKPVRRSGVAEPRSGRRDPEL